MTGPLVRRGDSGEEVRDLQRRLAGLGAEPTGEPGVFDDATHAALVAFQQRAGLRPDGICDRHTWNALVEAGYLLGDRQLYVRAPMMRGDDVADLQRRLGALGFDSGRIDGIFGPLTAAALAEFQRNSGLTPDGILGTESVAALRRLGQGRTEAFQVAQVRERVQLQGRVRELAGSRIALGEPGGLGALISACTHLLRNSGAHVVVLDHPDWSVQAREANQFGADCYIGVQVHAQPGVRAAFFQTQGFESRGGRHLAELVTRQLSVASFGAAPVCEGMRLPVLRETRMPAVLCDLGPPAEVVAGTAAIAAAIAQAIGQWLAEPIPATTLAATSASAG